MWIEMSQSEKAIMNFIVLDSTNQCRGLTELIRKSPSANMNLSFKYISDSACCLQSNSRFVRKTYQIQLIPTGWFNVVRDNHFLYRQTA